MDFYTNVQTLSNSVLYRGYSKGSPVSYKKDFSPQLFVKSQEHSEYTTLDGSFVIPIDFNTISEARDFIKNYAEVDNFEIFGNERYLYQFMSNSFPNDVDYDMNQLRIYVLDIETTSEHGKIDTLNCPEEITLITIKDLISKELVTFGKGEYYHERTDLVFVSCESEEDLLNKFVLFWAKNYPDIITGWNVNFDVNYIVKRVERIFGFKITNLLSPWKKINERKEYVNNRENIYFEILGISNLDYLELYKKFTYTNQESYKLDHISNIELGENKVENPFDTFREFYEKDWQTFVTYNIKDVELVERLENKMKLIELVLNIAYDAKVNYEDVLSQVRTWDSLIYNFLKKKNIVIPLNTKSSKSAQFAGAYVKDPTVGLYDWVATFDFTSMYPMNIISLNISPETVVTCEYLKSIKTSDNELDINYFLNRMNLRGVMDIIKVDDILNHNIDPYILELCKKFNFTLAPNGVLYNNKEQGFLPQIMERLFQKRKDYKTEQIRLEKEMENETNPDILAHKKKEWSKFNIKNLAVKVSLNSGYGALGTPHGRFYDLRMAEATTLNGQLLIQWVSKDMNNFINSILKQEKDWCIYSDTDSVFLSLDGIVKNFINTDDKNKIVDILERFCSEKIQPIISKSCQNLSDYLNCHKNSMSIKLEKIADAFLITAKKRYIINVYYNEGVRYKEPKLKITGLETNKSSTPNYYRNKLKEAFKLILEGDNKNLIDFIDTVREETYNQNPENIAFPRGVNGLDKYTDKNTLYKKGCPIHVRGTILYNYYLNKKNLIDRYPEIEEGSKVKFLYLRVPNTINENVISFSTKLPKEFGLHRYIDFDTQFEKCFLEPLRAVTKTIGWEVEEKITLDFLFS